MFAPACGRALALVVATALSVAGDPLGDGLAGDHWRYLNLNSSSPLAQASLTSLGDGRYRLSAIGPKPAFTPVELTPYTKNAAEMPPPGQFTQWPAVGMSVAQINRPEELITTPQILTVKFPPQHGLDSLVLFTEEYASDTGNPNIVCNPLQVLKHFSNDIAKAPQAPTLETLAASTHSDLGDTKAALGIMSTASMTLSVLSGGSKTEWGKGFGMVGAVFSFASGLFGLMDSPPQPLHVITKDLQLISTQLSEVGVQISKVSAQIQNGFATLEKEIGDLALQEKLQHIEDAVTQKDSEIFKLYDVYNESLTAKNQEQLKFACQNYPINADLKELAESLVGAGSSFATVDDFAQAVKYNVTVYQGKFAGKLLTAGTRGLMMSGVCYIIMKPDASIKDALDNARQAHQHFMSLLSNSLKITKACILGSYNSGRWGDYVNHFRPASSPDISDRVLVELGRKAYVPLHQYYSYFGSFEMVQLLIPSANQFEIAWDDSSLQGALVMSQKDLGHGQAVVTLGSMRSSFSTAQSPPASFRQHMADGLQSMLKQGVLSAKSTWEQLKLVREKFDTAHCRVSNLANGWVVYPYGTIQNGQALIYVDSPAQNRIISLIQNQVFTSDYGLTTVTQIDKASSPPFTRVMVVLTLCDGPGDQASEASDGSGREEQLSAIVP